MSPSATDTTLGATATTIAKLFNIVSKELFIAIPKTALANAETRVKQLYLYQDDVSGIAKTHTLLRRFDAFDSPFVKGKAIEQAKIIQKQWHKIENKYNEY